MTQPTNFKLTHISVKYARKAQGICNLYFCAIAHLWWFFAFTRNVAYKWNEALKVCGIYGSYMSKKRYTFTINSFYDLRISSWNLSVIRPWIIEKFSMKN